MPQLYGFLNIKQGDLSRKISNKKLKMAWHTFAGTIDRRMLSYWPHIFYLKGGYMSNIPGIMGGVGSVALSFLVKGFNRSSMLPAATSFIVGGETFQGAIDVVQSDLNASDKASMLFKQVIFGGTCQVLTVKAIEMLAPESLAARGVVAIFVGNTALVFSNNNRLPFFVQCFLGTSGRAAFWAGISLVLFTGTEWLASNSL